MLAVRRIVNAPAMQTRSMCALISHAKSMEAKAKKMEATLPEGLKEIAQRGVRYLHKHALRAAPQLRVRAGSNRSPCRPAPPRGDGSSFSMLVLIADVCAFLIAAGHHGGSRELRQGAAGALQGGDGEDSGGQKEEDERPHSPAPSTGVSTCARTDVDCAARRQMRGMGVCRRLPPSPSLFRLSSPLPPPPYPQAPPPLSAFPLSLPISFV